MPVLYRNTAENLSVPVPVAQGGTGATNAAQARTNLGLGTMAVQNANSVAITGGAISGITDLAVADGGTGASDAANARANLGAAALVHTHLISDLTDYPLTTKGDLLTRSASGNVRLPIGSDGQVLTADSSQTSGLRWAAAGGGSSLPVSDTTAIVQGSVDATKQLRFEVDGLTTGTTRVLTIQDLDGTIYVTGGADVAVADGGTGASDAAGARSNLGAAASGLNGDITSLTALTGGVIWTAASSIVAANYEIRRITGALAFNVPTGVTFSFRINNLAQLILGSTGLTLANDLAVTEGGTGASTASGARTNLGAAASGANADITSMTGLTGGLRAPTQIEDSSGNEVLKFASVASAVNEVTITNAASGGTPSVTASGTGTNVNLAVKSKGSGGALILEGGADMEFFLNGNLEMILSAGLLQLNNLEATILESPTIRGGTGAGDDLTLLSTSNPTKGNIHFGTASTYDQVNDRWGFGVLSPLGHRVHVKSTANPTFISTNRGQLFLQHGSSSLDQIVSLDFGYDDSGGGGSQNPIARIGMENKGTGSKLHFGTSSNYSNGVTNQALTIDEAGQLGIGQVSPSVALDIGSHTDALYIPKGTTAQRPTGVEGYQRYNSDLKQFEGFEDGVWSRLGPLEYSTRIEIFDDFVGTANGGIGPFNFNPAISGTAAQVNITQPGTDAFGVIECLTGSKSTGRAGIETSSSSIRFGGGKHVFETRCRVPTLSDGTNRFTVRIGFGDNITTDPTDGAFFRYVDSVNSGNWVCVTRSNGVETTSNTSIAPTTTGWQKLRIEVNAAASSVEFFIDGTSVATITTNIPSGAGRETAINLGIVKSLGTTSREFEADWVYFKIIPTTAR